MDCKCSIYRPVGCIGGHQIFPLYRWGSWDQRGDMIGSRAEEVRTRPRAPQSWADTKFPGWELGLMALGGTWIWSSLLKLPLNHREGLWISKSCELKNGDSGKKSGGQWAQWQVPNSLEHSSAKGLLSECLQQKHTFQQKKVITESRCKHLYKKYKVGSWQDVGIWSFKSG